MATRNSDGEGSWFHEEAKNLWQLRVTIAGKRRTFRAKTKKSCLEKASLARKKAGDGAVLGRAPKLADWLDTWLSNVVEPTRRPRTLEGYKSIAERHIKPAIGGVRLDQLTPQHIRAWLSGLTNSGLAPRTTRNAFAVLRGALEVARKDQLVGWSPAAVVTAPSAERPARIIIQPDELDGFLACFDGQLGRIVRLALTLGLRRGELLGLQWADIDEVRGELRITGSLQRVKIGDKGRLVRGPTKTHRSIRPLPILPAVAELFKAQCIYLKESKLRAGKRWRDENWVFCSAVGGPIEPRNLGRAFDAAIHAENQRRREANETLIPRPRLHDLRHMCVTMLRARGVTDRTIMEIVGHSQISTTSNLYGAVLAPTIAAALAATDEIATR